MAVTKIIQADSLATWDRHNHTGALQMLNSPRAIVYINVYSGILDVPKLPSGFSDCSLALGFASFAMFKQKVTVIDQRITTVIYDCEAWDKTPTIEQADPVKYSKLFGDLAHQHGFKYVACPSRSFKPWLMAGNANVVNLQIQSNEKNATTFHDLALDWTKRAKTINPDVRTTAEVSGTDRIGATPTQILAAIDALRDPITHKLTVVNGLWLFALPNAVLDDLVGHL